MFKLKQNGIFGDLRNDVLDFHSNRKQRFVLNGRTSSWASILDFPENVSLFHSFLNLY